MYGNDMKRNVKRIPVDRIRAKMAARALNSLMKHAHMNDASVVRVVMDSMAVIVIPVSLSMA